MFWGMILKPDTRYKTTVDKAFRISHAALEFKKPDDKACVKLLYKDLEFILCYLDTTKYIQMSLDLAFERDEVITLVSEGAGIVHLTGIMEEDEEEESDDEDALEYAQAMEAMQRKASQKRKAITAGASKDLALAGAKRPRPSMDDDDEDEDDSDFEASMGDSDDDLLDEEEDSEFDDVLEGEDDDLEMDSDMESFDEEGEDDDDADTSPEAKKLEKPKKTSLPTPTKKEKQDKKGKANKSLGPQTPTQKQSPEKQAVTPVNGESGKKKKNKNKKKKSEGATQQNGEAGNKDKGAASPGKAGPPAKEGGKKELKKNGVSISVLKEGTGPVAKNGQSAVVYYRGRLPNGKEFDKCTEGKGFRFMLGKGEVIKGWDFGVEGMKVGEKRRLTVPSKLAYGEKAIGKIPANSTLIFDVELKAVS